MGDKVIEVSGVAGLDTAFATARPGGTGTPNVAGYTADPIIAGCVLYRVTIDESDETLGPYIITLGDTTGNLGGRAVTITDGKDEYLLDDESAAAALNGPYSVTITVKNAMDVAIENVTVRMFYGSASESKLTDEFGVVVFTVEAALWTVNIAKNGYIGQSNLLDISEDTEQTYTLVLNSVGSPSLDGQCRCAANLTNRSGAPVEGYNIYATPTATLPISGDAVIMPTEEYSVTDSDGQAILDLVQGIEYEIKARKGSIKRTWVRTVPMAANYVLTLDL